MAGDMNTLVVGKIFTFDAAHQLVGHFGKCANCHGHTYKLEVMLKGYPCPNPAQAQEDETPEVLNEMKSSEGFVIDFYHLKQVVDQLIVSKMDHAFLARGDEPALQVLKDFGSKVVELGFRSTCENMASYICWRLLQTGLPVYKVRLWETPTGWAEVLAENIPATGPIYYTTGGCDLD